MRRRPFAVLLVCGLTAAAAISCAQLLVPGIDTSTREAGSDDASITDAGVVTDAGPKDPCAHQLPPGPPENDDAPGVALTMTFAFQYTQLQSPLGYDASVYDGSPAPRTVVGFDLDNGCTCQPDQHPLGAVGCTQPGAAKTPCDLEGGVDNQALIIVGAVAPLQKDASIDDLLTINHRIQTGDSTLLLTLERYNGAANDQEVQITLRSGTRPARSPNGDIAACAAAAERTSGDPNFPDASDRVPTFDGCDVWDYTLQGTPLHGYVTNHVLVISDEVETPFDFGSAVISLGFARMTAVLVRQSDGSFTLEDGIFGGRAPVDSVLNAARTLSASGQDGSPICHTAIDLVLPSYVCPNVDLAADPTQDYKRMGNGAGFTCQDVSVGYGFRASPAAFGTLVPDAGVVNSCSDVPVAHCP